MTNPVHKEFVVGRAISMIELIITGTYDSAFNAGSFDTAVKTQEYLKGLSSVQAHLHELKRLPIELLDLSTRPYNCLKREEVNTIGDLLDYSLEDLESIRSFGVGCVNEVCEKINKFGLQLRTGPRVEK